MKNQSIIRKSKPNFFSLGSALFMFYFSYNYFEKGSLVLSLAASTLGLLGILHSVLLLTTPLLIQDEEDLILKPKIPFEKKRIQLDDVADFKANSESVLIIVLKNGSKIKLDLAGYKKSEIEKIKKQLIDLLER